MVIDSSAWTEEYITRHLHDAQDIQADEDYLSCFLSDAPRPAAVLVPLLLAKINQVDQPVWQVLLTRRSETLAEHRGQVAFPGGRSDPDDPTPEATALREAQEEIGMHPSDVRLLGRLNNMVTITNYSVTPVVGVIPWPYSIRLAVGEVSRVFTIPLDWLANPIHHEVRQRTIPSPYSTALQANRFPVVYFQPYDGEVLWGVSAEITMSLIKTLYRK